jgi:DNA-binding PadR family transcriptional regulator
MGNDAKKTELAPGTPETLILKTIERNTGPMRGYEIARHIKRISNDVFKQEVAGFERALEAILRVAQPM